MSYYLMTTKQLQEYNDVVDASWDKIHETIMALYDEIPGYHEGIAKYQTPANRYKIKDRMEPALAPIKKYLANVLQPTGKTKRVILPECAAYLEYSGATEGYVRNITIYDLTTPSTNQSWYLYYDMDADEWRYKMSPGCKTSHRVL